MGEQRALSAGAVRDERAGVDREPHVRPRPRPRRKCGRDDAAAETLRRDVDAIGRRGGNHRDFARESVRLLQGDAVRGRGKTRDRPADRRDVRHARVADDRLVAACRPVAVVQIGDAVDHGRFEVSGRVARPRDVDANAVRGEAIDRGRGAASRPGVAERWMTVETHRDPGSPIGRRLERPCDRTARRKGVRAKCDVPAGA
ncbi:MAG: hypothetical protein NVS2B8_17860 [Vulcanimicrobiaceae bacterium]